MLTKIIYFPFAMIYLAIFMVCNILMMPFAYAFTIYRKLKLVIKNEEPSKKGTLIGNFFLFLFFGLILLFLAQFSDAFYFVLHLYHYKQDEL